MMTKIDNDENLTQFSRRNLKKLGQSFEDEKTLMSMRESRDTPPLSTKICIPFVRKCLDGSIDQAPNFKPRAFEVVRAGSSLA